MNSIIKIDPEFRAIVPPLTEEEYGGLEASILGEGCRDGLVVWSGIILDGHHRYEICQKHGISFRAVEKEFDSREEAKIWVITNQFARRNLTAFQRAELALRLKPLIAEKAKKHEQAGGGSGISGRQKSDKPINTKKELANICGLSHDTIHKAEKIVERATETIKQKVRNGEISINKAYSEIKKTRHRNDIQRQKQEIEQGIAELPEGKFEIIMMDVPWPYGTRYDPDYRRAASPYPEMEIEKIKELVLPASDDCILFFWTTHRFLWDAFEVIENYGFKYKGVIVWDKEKMGVGDWLRVQCEFCLIGFKGKPIWDAHDIRDIIREPRREHSRKPEAIYGVIEKSFVGRKLDYFSRQRRAGWEGYGSEIDRF